MRSNVAVAAAQLNLAYSEGTEIGTPRLDNENPGITVTSNHKDGEATIVTYSPEGQTIAPGEQLVLTIPYEATASSGHIAIRDLILAGITGNAIRCEYIFASSEPREEMPRAHELAQNYPNPFNPRTGIQ